MFEYESIAKNVEKAINQGLEELNLERDDVDIKILETGGFFKKAKVVLIVPQEIAEKNEAIIRLKKLKDLEKKAEEKLTATKFETKKIEQPEAKELKEEKNKNQKLVVEKPEENKQQEMVKERTEQKTVRQSTNDGIEETVQFVTGFVKIKDPDAVISHEIDGNYLTISIKVQNAGHLLGYHGNTLTNIQFLANIFIGKYSRHAKKVVLDVNDYKAKRKTTLEELAKRLCDRVKETGKSLELEPMTSYERRIIHTYVQSIEGMSSHSEGVEPNRHLILSKKEESLN